MQMAVIGQYNLTTSEDAPKLFPQTTPDLERASLAHELLVFDDDQVLATQVLTARSSSTVESIRRLLKPRTIKEILKATKSVYR